MKFIKRHNYRWVILSILALAPFVYFLLVIPESHKEKPSDRPPSLAAQDKPLQQETIPSTQVQPEPTAAPSTPACKLFTLPLAKQILGSDTSANINESVVLTDTTDMQVSSCVYSNKASRVIHFEAYTPKTTVGRSTNAVEFGSGRPSGVQNMPEYGQAAFWNSSDGTLHVLKHNSRYIIRREGNSLPDIKTAANIIVPKL